MRFSPLVLAGALVFAATPAMAQMFFAGRPVRGLSQQDADLLAESVQRLNDMPNLAVGAKDSWSDPRTRSGGENVVTAITEDSGTVCHKLRHEFTVRGRQPTRIYNLTWCRQPDGQWKVKS
ncbi:MAG TPA: hypothetical protein VFA03_03835 [Acetobacteraceae bacterium]|nr:hypothetical protein [Acetobacteraceae bacterium]